ncbi:MAG: hypothetical protein ACREX9_15680 [Gammaproteobacteria bacterium]
MAREIIRQVIDAGGQIAADGAELVTARDARHRMMEDRQRLAR